jgi:eukaryotic-like serine/threonine-protein kinase
LRSLRISEYPSGQFFLLIGTWLDNTRLYLTPYIPSEPPPLQLYLLDSSTNKVQQVLSLPTLGGDFDSSIDGTTLFTSQYSFAMPTAKGPSSIEAQPATGGQATTIYGTPDYAITGLRVASRTWLLFTIQNTGVVNVDTSHNGLWKIKTDGTGLSRLTSEVGDELTMFPTYTQYVWSTMSRDGSLYAVKLVHAAGSNAPASLLIGSMSVGKPVSIASSDNASMLDIAGWIQ